MCLVVALRNRYSVPCEWAGQMLSTRLYPHRADVVADERLIVSHARQFNSAQTVYDCQHYIDLVQCKPLVLRNGAPFLNLPGLLLRLRQMLLKRERADRAMAQVLAVVPQAVLVAVELVLKEATPTGSVSVEHVRNVLARLNAPKIPEQAETAL